MKSPLDFVRCVFAVSLTGIFSSCQLGNVSGGSRAGYTPARAMARQLATRGAARGEMMPFQMWGAMNQGGAVLVCVHGLGATSSDYTTLGETVADLGHTVYAVNLRGQGLNLVRKRCADIQSSDVWTADLLFFHRMLKVRHPERAIIWMGESLGSLVVMKSATGQVSSVSDRPEGLILASPAAGIRSMPNTFTVGILRSAAALFPGFRVTWEGITGQEFQATSYAKRGEIAMRGTYRLSSFTLRLLRNMDGMMNQMPEMTSRWNGPLLVLFTRNDPLSSPEQVMALLACSPTRYKKAFVFTKSYHLLFHDTQTDAAIERIAVFLDRFPP